MTPDRAATTRKVINALIDMLPPTGSVFPVAERKRWLDAMAAALVLGYQQDADVHTTIKGDEIEVRVVPLPSPPDEGTVR